jgi:uncharacterized membrane protein
MIVHHKLIIITFLMLVALPAVLTAQGEDDSAKPQQSDEEQTKNVSNVFKQVQDNPVPLPYRRNEFRGGARDVLRFGIISAGAFPITFGLSTSVMVLTAPSSWDNNQRLKVGLIAGGGLALSIALGDFIVGKVEAANREKRWKNTKATSN